MRTDNPVATIDQARTSPPPSVLAPVDLTDPTQVAAVMTIGARVGEILIANGTTSSDAKAQIHAVTSSYGLHYCHVDITMNTITINSVIGTVRKQPVNVFRVVTNMTENFSKLQEVDRLIRSIRAGATPPEIAEKILDELEAAAPPYPLWVSIAGWAIMGASIAILLGGDLLMSALGAVTATIITVINAWMGRNELPYFYHCVVGGFVATVPAAVFYTLATHVGTTIVPSQVIATGIIVLLAGLTLVQSLQDGVTGSPVTASGRFFQAVLFTGAIIAGVAGGIQIADMFGAGLPPIETQPPTPTYGSAIVRSLGGVFAAAGFALAVYAEIPAIIATAATAFFGGFTYYAVLIPFGSGRLFATTLCAIMVGLAGGLIARRYLIAPLIVEVAGVTPFLPGSGVYRGMYALLNDQTVLGLNNIFIAVSTCMALAGGVVLGEWIARRIRRPQMFNPYNAFRAAGRITFQQIRRAEQAAMRRRAEQIARNQAKKEQAKKQAPQKPAKKQHPKVHVPKVHVPIKNPLGKKHHKQTPHHGQQQAPQRPNQLNKQNKQQGPQQSPGTPPSAGGDGVE